MTRRNFLTAILVLAPLAAIVLASRAHAQTGTDRIVQCLDNASAAFYKCVDEHAWYVAPLCDLRFNADWLLCLPTLGFKSLST